MLKGSASRGCRSPEAAPQGWESLQLAALAGIAAFHQLLGHVTAFCSCIKTGAGLPLQHQSWERSTPEFPQPVLVPTGISSPHKNDRDPVQ